jgi:hypothetical protein
MNLNDDDDENEDDYNDNASDGDNDGNEEDNEVAPEEADAPPKDKSLRRVRLLAGVVRTNQDYGLSHMVRLPDASADAPAVFKAVELQAPTFFASRLLVPAGGFSEEDPPICFRCLRWNLTALFLQCNRDCWSRCGCCSDIQHAQCKNVGYPSPFGTFCTLSVLLILVTL